MYLKAAEIFEREGRAFEAGKCYFLAKDYRMAFNKFQDLNIRKYMGECLWKSG